MGKKKDILEVKKEFEERGYELLSTEYVNQKQKLEFLCKKHIDKGVQYIDYNHFRYRDQGCHYCAKERRNEIDRTHIEEIKRITEENGFEFVDVKYTSEADGNVTQIYYICPKHKYVGVQKRTLPSMKKNNKTCPYCERVLDTYTFKEKLKYILPNVDIMGEYSGQKNNVLCRCIIHDEKFYGKPYKLLGGSCGCKKCKKEKIQNNQRLTTEEYKKRLHLIHPELIVVGEYIDSTTPIKMYCTIHNYYFYESPNTYLYKKKMACCPMGNVQLKIDEDFKNELNDRFGENIISLESYKGYNIPILFKCLKHDVIWKSTPRSVLKGKGCKKCISSTGELIIYNFLDKCNYFYISQKTFDDCRDIKPLPFDFYIPSINLIIEYDGEGHYLESFYENRSKTPKEDLEKTQYHDNIKNKYCHKNGINLLRIPYWEKENIDKIIQNEIEKCKFKLAS